MSIRRPLHHNTRERTTTKPENQPKVWNKHHGNAPSDAVYIGRGSEWGNPFKIGKDGNREQVIEKFENLIRMNDHMIDGVLTKTIKRELRGKHLVCFCAPKLCHGDVLLRIANSEE